MVQLLYIIASLHTLLCPFTKVEESFNIQATHDILYHRLNLSEYDHNEFPGVVPRSFVGPLFLSALAAPTVAFFNLVDFNKFCTQYAVRLALALTVIAAWIQLKNTLKKLYGNTYAWWYTLITVTQYHFMFYMSRPLPNIMVLPLVLLAFEGWLSNKHKQFLISAGASIVIFRSELAMLFGLFLIMDLYFKKIEVARNYWNSLPASVFPPFAASLLKIRLLKIVIPAGLGLVALTVAVDSFFWRRLIWPEAEVFWYNTILNKSSNWGTLPFLWYFYSALPRGLGPSLVLIPVGLHLDRRMLQVAAPALVYILLYSVLPHKELRFIIYVFPLLNMASAAACSYIYIRRTKAPIYELMFWGQIVIVVGNIAMAVTLVCVAMTNYPGGLAMARFHKLLRHEPFVHVHICNLAAQTGVTRYTQLNKHWMYSKNESLEPEQLQEYTHLLVEAKSKYSPTIKAFALTHEVLDSVESFSHIALSYKLMPPVKVKTKPAIFILERKDFHEHPYGRVGQKVYKISENTQIDEKLIEEPVADVTDENEEDYDSPEMEPITKSKDIIEEEVKATDVIVEKDNPIIEESVEEPITQPEEIVNEVIDEQEVETLPKLPKAKKALDELKVLRKERKKKAIEKIKSETRKEVVASAKEKLKEIMKRHKHIADGLSENIISNGRNETDDKDKDRRGDIPESETMIEPEAIEEKETQQQDEEALYSIILINETLNSPNENVDAIVEEVIVRLIDRKVYDHKTKPEDIKSEDRLIIQKIVEEVLSERMNYTKAN